MARLAMSLLGPLEVTLDGAPVSGFESNKVRALLAYLAVEADRPHHRQVLAGLLWPDWPDRTARTYLRNALADLRHVIGDHEATPPFLMITPQTLQFNRASDYWLDVAAFEEKVGAAHTAPAARQQLEEAVALYHGDFMEGFSLKDSLAFEDWSLMLRERLQRQILTALSQLAGYYEQQGEYARATDFAWLQVELAPWQEEAHQQLMRLLALGGQRSAALAQYETCCRLLQAELGVDPAVETTALFEQIEAGTLETSSPAPIPSPQLPAFLNGVQKEPSSDGPVFVARRRELARLDEHLAATFDDHGQVVFVTGGAGCGKTTLIEEFAHRAQVNYPDLIVADGNCNAYTGIGDPYLPFRQILELLTGEVEARYAAGAISRQHACRLWYLIPWSIKAILADGRDLVETFLPGGALIRRATAFAHWSGRADWLPSLEELVKRKTTVPADPSLQQSALFEQYSRILQALASQRPLLLVLDDLQWADPGSNSLLFHLGRRIGSNRILMVGAYRPAELALGYPFRPRGAAGTKEMERHPLEQVVNELKHHFGDIELDLGQVEDRQLVDAFLDTEPNRLGDTFREALYRQTGGHPLFTVELVRGMQDRGDLVRDQQGRWIKGPALDWDILPARVEAVIAERIGRLPDRLQEALTVASVQGETFAAELIAQVIRVDERDMMHWLSGELERRYRLVKAQGVRQMDGGRQRLSQYRFRHILFQKYLYSQLDQVERVHLHEAMGTALEALNGQEATDIAVELALHFQKAGIAPKAIDYLRRAGERAMRLSANAEAIAHFSQALELLETLPDTPEHRQQEVTLRVALGNVLGAAKGYVLEVGQVFTRAWELCQEIDESTQLFPVLFGLWAFHYTRAELLVAHELGRQFLHLAQRRSDPAFLVVAHNLIGTGLWTLGEIAPAREHLEQSIALYNRQQHCFLAFFYAHDPEMASLTHLALSLWLLGYPDQALAKSHEALALDQEVSHPGSLAFALSHANILRQFRREVPAVQKQAEALIALSNERGFPLWSAGAIVMQGWVLFEQGQQAEGIAWMIKAFSVFQAAEAAVYRSYHLALLAEAYGKVGEVDKGLAFLEEALAIVDRTGERFCEAEIYRLKGELLLKDEGGRQKAEAEAYFLKAIEVARAQQARSLELRATINLSRLWQQQGRAAEARQLLEEIYDWFTEGFDTVDLKKAKKLLKELA